MVPEPELVERFRRDLDALIAPGTRLGIAVSGGPDSIALLLLAAAARPGLIEAATVDHALRPDSRAEADMVAALCEQLDVQHEILTIEWADKPDSAIQERARAARYGLLSDWMRNRALAALATAHHADDQAETLLMRLNRGSGVRGLGAMRGLGRIPGTDLPLLRPLLGWRRGELQRLCADAAVAPAADPSNADERFERVRIRNALAEADWLKPEAVTLSAAHLASADEALDWAADQEWLRSVAVDSGEIEYRPSNVPPEIARRLVARAIAVLGGEGDPAELRGRELDRVIEELSAGRPTTLRGVLCTGGETWTFVPAPHRTRPPPNLC